MILISILELSIATLLNNQQATANSSGIYLYFRPPMGHYDYFTIQLSRLSESSNKNTLSTSSVLIKSENYTFEEVLKLMSASSYASNNNSLMLAFAGQENIRAGYAYELSSETHRSSVSVQTKLGKSFLIVPDSIRAFDSFVVANGTFNITWLPALDLIEAESNQLVNNFIQVEVYSLRSELVYTGTTQISDTHLLVDDLAQSGVYTISVRVCSMFSEMKVCSNEKNISTSFKRNLISKFNADQQIFSANESTNTTQVSSRASTSLLIKWQMKTSNRLDLCDTSVLRLDYINLNTNAHSQCYTSSLLSNRRLHCMNNERQQEEEGAFEPNDLKRCPQDELACKPSQFDNFTQHSSYELDCSMLLNRLRFNSRYNISMTLLSKHGRSELQNAGHLIIRTEVGLPVAGKTYKIRQNRQLDSQVSTGQFVALTLPEIDQSNGPILESYLYAVRLGESERSNSSGDNNNRSDNSGENSTIALNASRFILNVIDQDYLASLVEPSTISLMNCSLNSSIMEPCFLRRAARMQSDFRRERLMFVGRLLLDAVGNSDFSEFNFNEYLTNILRNLSADNSSSSGGIGASFNYESVITDYLRPSNVYQFFLVFKIGYDSISSNSRTTLGKRASVVRSSPLYYATQPSDPIMTKTFTRLSLVGSVDASSSGLGKQTDRTGSSMWLIIAVSVVAFILLAITIIIVSLVFVHKYRPSKFPHKAAQIVAQPYMGGVSITDSCNNHNNNNNILSALKGGAATSSRNKFTISNVNCNYMTGTSIHTTSYLGYGADFIVPGEFSRYDMTNIWLVKHANGDLILEEEYRHLPEYRDMKTSFASQSIKNEIKNRFLDVKAYDETRVILNVGSNNNNNSNNSNNNNNNNNSSGSKNGVEKIANSNSQNSVDKSNLSSMSTSTSSNNSNELLEMHEHAGALSHLGDYINANFVQGYSYEKKFIATQGPKKETIVDFWRMIYQYKVRAVVMLTKLVEKGVERCTQYWPDISDIYGDFEVTFRDEIKCGDYVKRTFDVINLNAPATTTALEINTTTMATVSSTTTSTTLTAATQSTPGGTLQSKRVLQVTQYYYPEWPDKDTPTTDPMSILHLIRDVNENHPPYHYPIVVHCSAGVGRTGTYITLDAMMEKIDKEGKIDIFGFISKIRERRQLLVQTPKQYVFIHEALYEYCLYGFTDIKVDNLASKYKYLKELSPFNSQGMPYQGLSNKTRMQVEYEKLTNEFTPNSQAREAFSSENKHRNRYLNTICYDENRVRLSVLYGSTYINATKINGYELKNELIITQDPMANTLFEFWKMASEYECHIIVSLNKEFQLEKESVYWPTVDVPKKVYEMDDLKYTVVLVNSSSIGSDVCSQDTPRLTLRQEFELTEQSVRNICFNIFFININSSKILTNHMLYVI
jgi:protein tyrosine phosphatase